MRNIIFLFIAAFLLVFCSRNVSEQKKPIARVFDKYLYLSDLENAFPKKVTSEDSIVILKSITEKWIRKQLLLRKAELNLTQEQKDVSRQLNDYRASLLIFKYKQQLVRQKLDTIISAKDIENYYHDNQSNFILDKNIIKGLFIKIPKTAPNLEKVKVWYLSENPEDMIHLEDYCYQFASKYDYFDDRWIVFNDLLDQIPFSEGNQENYLRYRKNIEIQDSLYYYFVNIKEYKLKGEIPPLEFVQNNIKNILLNKHRLTFETELEKDIFNEALNRNEFEIFN